MIQTLSDVSADRDGFLKRLDSVNEKIGSDGVYDRSVMDGVVVWPDQIAKQFMEALYRFDTHVVPGGLPGSGMAIGDLLEHEGARYLTAQIGVMTLNAATFHLVRRHETLYREWTDRLSEYHEYVQAFLGALPKKYHRYFPRRTFEREQEWRRTYTGFNYVGSPDEVFVNALRDLPSHMAPSNKRMQRSLEIAACLERELRPFVGLVKVMEQIRKELGRKGIPIIKDGMLSVSSPAASGGASLHTHPANDDLCWCLPGTEALMIIGAQTPHVNVIHVGAGSVKGEHYILTPPKTPFFARVQERLDAEPVLRDEWEAIRERGCDLKDFRIWDDATAPIKAEVVREVVPGFLPTRVLGFYLDLMNDPHVAHLYPVIAESAFGPNQELIEQNGWNVIRPTINEVALEDSRGYFKFLDSVFAEG